MIKLTISPRGAPAAICEVAETSFDNSQLKPGAQVLGQRLLVHGGDYSDPFDHESLLNRGNLRLHTARHIESSSSKTSSPGLSHAFIRACSESAAHAARSESCPSWLWIVIST